MHDWRQTRVSPWWAALAVAGAVVWLWSGLGAQRCCKPAPAVVYRAPPAAVQRLVSPSPVRVAPAVALAARAAPALGRAEVCGYGTVELAPDDPDPLQRIPPALRVQALQAMDELMLASDDVQVRAAALWMGARLRGRDVQSRIEQVARLAIASQDPFVYAMALEACKVGGGDEGGSCRLLSTAQWVRLDPDNAVPWHALAAQAHALDEPQAEDLALQLAARASRHDVHAGRLPELVNKALGARLAPLQRTLALSAGWSAEAVWAASHGVPVMSTTQGYDLSCEGVNRLLASNTAPR